MFINQLSIYKSKESLNPKILLTYLELLQSTSRNLLCHLSRRGRESLPLSQLVSSLSSHVTAASSNQGVNSSSDLGHHHHQQQQPVVEDAGYGSTAYSPLHPPASNNAGGTIKEVHKNG